ncbi:MAG: DUF4956 domain-containing protein [Bryobacteraceae bacterium]
MGGLLCFGVVWLGIQYDHLQTPMGSTPGFLGGSPPSEAVEHRIHPLAEVLKLIIAAALGLLVTAVHRRYHGEKPMNRTFAQAQVLLCVAAALMMIIIGTSVARALGVAGGASMVRFRTPVEDPKDATILFLLLGIGMSCGLGNFAVAGLGAAFLCLVLIGLDRFSDVKPRMMMLDIKASGPEFPEEHVHRVLGYMANSYEPREFLAGREAARKYLVNLDSGTSLAYLNKELIKDGTAGISSVSWVQPKKSD